MFRSPMLCQSIKEAELSNYGSDFVCQDKIDGVRAIISVTNGKVEIQGRRNYMTHRYPEFHSLFSPSTNFVIDAEILTKDGVFNSIQVREQNNKPFKVNLLRQAFPCRIHAFDLLELEGRNLSSIPFIQRYELLKKVVVENDDICILQLYDNFSERFNYIKSINGEGIIVKKKDGWYEEGKRSHNWLKCKNFKETTHTFTQYEVNNAGVTVSDGDVRMQVAGRNSELVKFLIDANGKVELEIQYLEMTKNGCYRMPTFRGIVK